MTTIRHTTQSPLAAPAVDARPVSSTAGPSFGDALERAESRLGLPPMFQTATGGRVSLDDMENELSATLDALRERLGGAAREARLRTPPPLAIGFDRDGALAIDPHPQKAAFTQLLDGEARREMGRAIALKQLLAAGQEAAAFQAAYRENPDAAVSRYAHLFGGQSREQPKLLMALEGGRPTFAFASSLHAFHRR